jgi:hypothetical protein
MGENGNPSEELLADLKMRHAVCTRLRSDARHEITRLRGLIVQTEERIAVCNSTAVGNEAQLELLNSLIAKLTGQGPKPPEKPPEKPPGSERPEDGGQGDRDPAADGDQE